MPNGLTGHEIVSIGYDLIVIGGFGDRSYQNSIYKLSCFNHECEWEQLQVDLNIAREYFTAIPLPDNFLDWSNFGECQGSTFFSFFKNLFNKKIF